MLRLLELTYDDLLGLVTKRYEKGPFLAKSLYGAFYKDLRIEAWRREAVQKGGGLRERLMQDWRFSPGRIQDVINDQGLVKFVTELTDGHRIESVILPLKTHRTLCVSSQAACGQLGSLEDSGEDHV